MLLVWAFFGILLVALVAIAVFAPAAMPPDGPLGRSISLVRPDGMAFHLQVDVADDEAERATGLMHRSTVTRGMLFVFEEDAPRGFWMKNTLVPLDISFFTGAGDFVSKTRMEPCEADPCPTYPSRGAARYALELPADGVGPPVDEGWKLILN